MKRNGIIYAILVLLALLVFQVIAFAIPHADTGAFWVGYAFTCVALVLQCVFAFIAFDRVREAKKAFLGLSIAVLGIEYLVLQLIVGLVSMFVPVIPTWCALVVCILILALYLGILLAASSARNVVVARDAEVAAKSEFIRDLTAQLKSLLATCQQAQLREQVMKAYEAVRYSDPMSGAFLLEVQSQMEQAFSRLTQAAGQGDYELAGKSSMELCALCARRNELCRQHK